MESHTGIRVKAAFVIVFTGGLLYLQTLNFGLTYLDDQLFIVNKAEFFGDASNILEVFKRGAFLSHKDIYYRPLLIASMVLDAQFSKAGSLLSYRLTNILIHLTASCLVFFLLIKLKMKDGFAFFFSLIFCVHPALASAVAWIPGRTDSLPAVFLLSSFICFLNRRYLWHLILFAMAVLCKEVAFILIPVCLLYRILLDTDKDYRFPVLGYFFVTAWWFLLRGLALSKPAKIMFSGAVSSFFSNLPAAIQYIGKAMLPFNLSAFPIIKDTGFGYGVAATALIITALVLSREKRVNFIIFGSSWFFIFLLPSFLFSYPSNANVFFEYRLYLPLVGIAIVMNEAIPKEKLPKMMTLALRLAMAVVVFILAYLTFHYSGNYKDRITFWENAARASPHSAFTHRNLGAMYYLDSVGARHALPLLDKAEAEYKKALELNEYEPMAYNNLGLIYTQKGRLNEAEDMFKKELSFNPDYDDALFNYGLLLSRTGRQEEARRMWEKALDVNPDYNDAREALKAVK